MLSLSAIESMLESGSATLADIATHFNVPLAEVYEFSRVNGLSEPTLESPVMRGTRKLIGAERPDNAVDWERLLWDDDEGHVINGIDTRATNGNINANEIIRYYHGGCNCLYTNRPTDLVMAADANQANILVSNLIPIVSEVVEERFKETPPIVVQHAYTFGLEEPGPFYRLTVNIEHRFDKLLGTASNRLLVDACMDRWVRPYFEKQAGNLLPYRLPMTPELLNVWTWQQLSTKALLKGLATLKLEPSNGPTAFLTKQTVLFQLKQMLQRQFGQRSLVTSQPAVMPGHVPPPTRLIKL